MDPTAATESASPPAGQPSDAEVRRVRQRRRLARKTPEQRRHLQQYQRRHNEKDERLYYCDYCDLFISSRHKTWMTHLRSARHIDAFQSYYNLVAHVESVWLSEIHREVELARGREAQRLQQRAAGRGATTPLAAQQVAPGIVVGGVGVPSRPPPPPYQPPPPPPPPPLLAGSSVTVRVGPTTWVPPAASPTWPVAAAVADVPAPSSSPELPEWQRRRTS
ncbi:U1 small nuclear ribonucleoprotein C [Novymonas esmeraldas]|uniref:U1 small nuclear ribonucleoprotein C n=1 Tax=Novymonas esmeraldas TaxID=1808958 RepID=A0AAW0F1C0_9TRYP